jgi:glycosyltransferase involved in cell wall biosynthesis
MLLAVSRHPGLYVSHELEFILDRSGAAVVPLTRRAVERTTPTRVENVVHVCSYVSAVGGHSRLVWRWICRDKPRRHSLALTGQRWKEIPDAMGKAVRASGGGIHFVNASPGGVLAQARRLCAIAEEADLIVVHTNSDDALPVLAFANLRLKVPVVYVDHTDHWAWVGAGTSNVVVSLRESGMRLARARRGVDPKRSLLLPTPVEPINRIWQRREAKRALGIAEDCVVLLSIARKDKYDTINGISYADAHAPLLLKHPQVILIVVGAGVREDWASAIRKTNGRIIAHEECPDTRPFYEAADIYVDSFPFVSITSLLEAGMLGLPLVSLFPHSTKSETFGADMPGFAGQLQQARSHAEYIAYLTVLIGDEERRQRIGNATRAQILEHHTGPGWQMRLEEVYRRALELGPSRLPKPSADQPVLDEPDVLVPLVFGRPLDPDAALRQVVKSMPPIQRLAFWVRQVRAAGSPCVVLRIGARCVKSLVPDWLLLRLRYRKPY